jgi:Ni,Fe-hydrogenase III large subunit/Ni,Fe-hydrogenase III component G
MQLPDIDLAITALSAPLPMGYAQVTPEQWLQAAHAVQHAGGRLIALWAGPANAHDAHPKPECMYAAYATQAGAFWLAVPLTSSKLGQMYPDLSALFPAAARMQRAARDLSGVQATDFDDARPWLNHGAWSADQPPLCQGPQPTLPLSGDLQDYAFVRVEGDGVHEIAVGPVHAGVIEPGHFRFSVVGEKVLRLEQRLGYTHKGIEQRMAQLPPLEAYRLAGRVSGDSTVAYGWAYCMALESACGVQIAPRATWLRALLLERERVANHLGDLGALGNDAAFAFALAQFSRLREDWLRLSKQVFGHRWLMDCIIPGGLGVNLDRSQCAALAQQCNALESELGKLHEIFESHAGLQDRLMATGRVAPELAARLGLTGLAGRASGQSVDLRTDHPFAPYDALNVLKVTHHSGDVAARVAVRFDEVFESLRLMRQMLRDLPEGEVRVSVSLPEQPSRGAGWVEGWRGEVWVALDMSGADASHRILRCHLHDPSWQNWPVLEHAIIGNIVADFPLINKSFNLSYSGQDL